MAPQGPRRSRGDGRQAVTARSAALRGRTLRRAGIGEEAKRRLGPCRSRYEDMKAGTCR